MKREQDALITSRADRARSKRERDRKAELAANLAALEQKRAEAKAKQEAKDRKNRE